MEEIITNDDLFLIMKHSVVNLVFYHDTTLCLLLYGAFHNRNAHSRVTSPAVQKKEGEINEKE